MGRQTQNTVRFIPVHRVVIRLLEHAWRLNFDPLIALPVDDPACRKVHVPPHGAASMFAPDAPTLKGALLSVRELTRLLREDGAVAYCTVRFRGRSCRWMNCEQAFQEGSQESEQADSQAPQNSEIVFISFSLPDRVR